MPDLLWRSHTIPIDERGCGFLSAPGFELQFYPLTYPHKKTFYRAHLSVANEDTARGDGADATAALEAARVTLLAWREAVDVGCRALLGEESEAQ